MDNAEKWKMGEVWNWEQRLRKSENAAAKKALSKNLEVYIFRKFYNLMG
ncbi:MAG: hypothetical protein ACRC37_03040 [Lentisphaeria bacterium]